MLTPYDVLTYIKTQLAASITGIEFNDEEILNIVRNTALRKFSLYCPDIKNCTIDPSNPVYQTDKPNVFKIIDPDNRKIIRIEKTYPPQSSVLIQGHPIIGAGSYNELPSYALEAERAASLGTMSMFTFYTKFRPPNLVEVYPTTAVMGEFSIDYSREHAPDFSTIDNLFETYFLDLALGYVMQTLGRARTRFGSISTPYGEINLNGDALVSDGKELIDNTIEQLKTAALPYIEVDRG